MPSRDEVKQVLAFLDTNKNGKVSADELKAFLDSSKCTLDKALVKKFLDSHDKNKDGELDLDELACCLSGA
ncbi:unnamed protein product [Dicrocoelium dendriticum]|nr:unnamed protein product [Dicrocoelium dendriticum]